ncbi:MAG: hypothetical protein JWN30_583 [Bacilli bacterium]|nr:hypothetical protein [Bacilli bacterium]
MMTMMLITWKEILRKRVLLITVVLTLLFLGLYVFAVSQITKSSAACPNCNSLMQSYIQSLGFLSAGLYFANFVVAFLMIFSSVGTLSTEIENGILLAILPRPIRRWEIYFGKWLGFTLWGLLYAGLLFLALLGIVNHYLHFPIDYQSLGKALAIFLLIPLVLSALSVFGSSFLPTLGNGIALALLFCLGLLGGLLEQLMSLNAHLGTQMSKVGVITSMLIPTDSLYRRVTYELMGGSDLPLGGNVSQMLGPFASTVIPSNSFIWYSLIYVVVVLMMGAIYFTRRDI